MIQRGLESSIFVCREARRRTKNVGPKFRGLSEIESLPEFERCKTDSFIPWLFKRRMHAWAFGCVAQRVRACVYLRKWTKIRSNRFMFEIFVYWALHSITAQLCDVCRNSKTQTYRSPWLHRAESSSCSCAHRSTAGKLYHTILYLHTSTHFRTTYTCVRFICM